MPLSTRQASAEYLSDLFRALVGDSRRFLGEAGVDIGIHQIRKLAGRTVKEKMGFSEVRIEKELHSTSSKFKRSMHTSWGTFIPDRTHELSDSDSD